MPWDSAKQRRWGNSPAGHKALGDKAVNEFNQASKGMKLPETKGPSPQDPKPQEISASSKSNWRK